ncbi:hypothetical protein C2E23DRAFT_727989 [Lenzites betulinus]|nr:hypothetical protein C2E23DRAFT_727989 [Lenzites betulinus]
MDNPSVFDHDDCVDDTATESVTRGINAETPWLPVWVSNEFYETRLKTLLDHVREVNSYSISRVPAAATWGDGSFAPVLCVNKHPITILVLGEIQTIAAAVDLSSELSSVKLRLQLLRDSDYALFSTWIEHARGFEATCPDFFECSRTDRHSMKIFERVYDGTTSTAPKVALPKLVMSDLCAGDIVVVECAITRESLSPNGSWLKFRTRFSLGSVILLARAPRR